MLLTPSIQYVIYNKVTDKFVSEGNLLNETTLLSRAEIYKSMDIAIIRLNEFRERVAKRDLSDTHIYKIVEVQLNYQVIDRW